jgi:hypothetical protein
MTNTTASPQYLQSSTVLSAYFSKSVCPPIPRRPIRLLAPHPFFPFSIRWQPSALSVLYPLAAIRSFHSPSSGQPQPQLSRSTLARAPAHVSCFRISYSYELWAIYQISTINYPLVQKIFSSRNPSLPRVKTQKNGPKKEVVPFLRTTSLPSKLRLYIQAFLRGSSSSRRQRLN